MRLFRNDYSEFAAPQIMEALVAIAAEQSAGYTEEGDAHCEHARELIRAMCGQDDAMVEFCIGGTSANVICLNGLLRDWEGVICTPDAHINVHETGALGACGRTVLATTDTDGFLTPEAAEAVWQFQNSCGRHMTLPGAIYITNATEKGGVWTRERFDAICDWACERGLGIFLDGARLGSALTSEGNDLSLRHIASRVDAFYLGGTKCGLAMGEAVVICGHTAHAERLREAFPFLQKERCGLLAKGYLLGVQFERAFAREGVAADGTPWTCEEGEELFWQLARHANAMAAQLRRELVEAGFEPYGESTSNQQFFVVSDEEARALEQACGCETFYTLPGDRRVIRFVCSWATTEADVAELVAFAKALR